MLGRDSGIADRESGRKNNKCEVRGYSPTTVLSTNELFTWK